MNKLNIVAKKNELEDEDESILKAFVGTLGLSRFGCKDQIQWSFNRTLLYKIILSHYVLPSWKKVKHCLQKNRNLNDINKYNEDFWISRTIKILL